MHMTALGLMTQQSSAQGHVMCKWEGCLWLFGGYDALGQLSQRLFCLDLDSLSAGFSPRKLAAR